MNHGLNLSFTDSFSRNLPLLIPYLGPIMETALAMMGKPRMGDRLVALCGVAGEALSLEGKMDDEAARIS